MLMAFDNRLMAYQNNRPAGVTPNRKSHPSPGLVIYLIHLYSQEWPNRDGPAIPLFLYALHFFLLF